MTSGHVDHGKSTLVWSLTGVFPDTHSEEIKRGITIKLGYADLWIRECPKCLAPHNFMAKEKCPVCASETKPVRRISLLDAPGHETLMATVVAASSIVDGALFIVAANEECPQPQTLEHLMVLEAAGVKKIIVLQSKVDLVEKPQAERNHKQIIELLKGSAFEGSPIVPISAINGTNLDVLLYAVQQLIPTPKRDEAADPLMFIARSFDINVPGTKPPKLAGGILGGSIVRGTLSEGDEIEILPGYLEVRKERESYKPIKTKIISLNAGGPAKAAKPGGLVGIGTTLDPALTRADALVGSMVGKPGSLPPVVSTCGLEITPMKRQMAKFSEGFVENEPLVLGIGTATTVGFVLGKMKGNRKAVEVKLKKPVCAKSGDTFAVLRRTNNRWHFYGTAKVV